MKEITSVIATVNGPKADRLAAQKAFLRKRAAIWEDIQAGKFPASYISADGKKFVGASSRTALRCDFLLANKIALGRQYGKDEIADIAQRDLLFFVLRDREAFGNRTGKKFYCCPTCTSKLYECVSAKVFRYIDNAKWKALMEA